ncbi:MAG: hypothetical protein IJ860_00030 [Eubacterium sp.]|nr:hypothetical protein [Eubacterium sp.]
MKQNKWRIMIGIFVLLAIVGIGRPRKVDAAAFKPAKTYYLDVTANAKKYGTTVEELLNNFKIQIESVKSSKPSVLKVKKDNYGFMLRPLKAGSAKLTVTYTTEAGKKKTIKTTVKTRAYKNPVKQFTVGSTSFTKRFAKDNVCQYSYPTEETVKGKLNIKAAGGWKIVKIQKYDFYKSKWSTLKNGKNYTFSCGSDRLVVTLKHTKSGYIRTLTVNEMG